VDGKNVPVSTAELCIHSNGISDGKNIFPFLNLLPLVQLLFNSFPLHHSSPLFSQYLFHCFLRLSLYLPLLVSTVCIPFSPIQSVPHASSALFFTLLPLSLILPILRAVLSPPLYYPLYCSPPHSPHPAHGSLPYTLCCFPPPPFPPSCAVCSLSSYPLSTELLSPHSPHPAHRSLPSSPIL
jgi:hypothetical protein